MAQRVVLVTGASSGIGRATAERLAAGGDLVYGAARRMGSVGTIAGVVPIAMDISRPEQA